MSMIRDQNSKNRTLYQGSSASFINYIVEALNLRWFRGTILKSICIVTYLVINLSSLEYVKENATEVAKIGQMNAAYKSLENEESYIINCYY